MQHKSFHDITSLCDLKTFSFGLDQKIRDQIARIDDANNDIVANLQQQSLVPVQTRNLFCTAQNEQLIPLQDLNHNTHTAALINSPPKKKAKRTMKEYQTSTRKPTRNAFG